MQRVYRIDRRTAIVSPNVERAQRMLDKIRKKEIKERKRLIIKQL